MKKNYFYGYHVKNEVHKMKTNEAKSNNMPIFAARFAELRGERTQAEFAEFLGISRPTVGFYENGERIPDAFVLKQIAERCGVTTDYLVGLSNVKTTDRDLQTINNVTGLSEEAISVLEDLNGTLHESASSVEKLRGCKPVSFICLVNEILENPNFTLSMFHLGRSVELMETCTPEMAKNNVLKEMREKYPEVVKSGAEIVARIEFADYLYNMAIACLSKCISEIDTEKVFCDQSDEEGAINADDPETR